MRLNCQSVNGLVHFLVLHTSKPPSVVKSFLLIGQDYSWRKSTDRHQAQILSNEAERLRGQNEIQEDIRRLSPTATKLLTDTTEGTLNSEDFTNLLLYESFGKPKPPVLPIVRSFSVDVDGVVLQLQYFRSALEKYHDEHRNEHKKDMNLIRRIGKLIKNIEKEQNNEMELGRHQTSMTEYMTR
ncbi:hypothetical protein NPIL_502621 [Nephila pilipes]|uniref:Uncharacterized protein n=1 Tax=Nephila pilipes TaxID=299642 RepID=A0A8X6I390_NEPPI|nr:hypothetical protein NPIL_502621 [Nephila pilipes]